MKIICLALFVLFLNFSCKREKVIGYSEPAQGKCNADAENVYHYIIPKSYNGRLPLLIILDSGGDGLMAVKKTVPALVRIPCVVIGSDLVRNNFPDFQKVIEILIEDAGQKFNTSKEQVFFAGFSGGARMAFEYSRKHHVSGVLMLGAGPVINPNEELPCPVYMITGTTDFNFHETFYNPLNVVLPKEYMADYFSGSHEWPPAEMMKEAYLFLMGNSVPGGRRMLKQESGILAEKADSLLQHGNIFFALKALEKAIKFNPGNKEAKKQFQKIKMNLEFSAKISKIESDLQQENKINQAYSKASMERDSSWWANELKELSMLISKNKDEQKDHYLRIKGFLGILFYSRLNTLIRIEPDNPRIVHLLAAYRIAEPENPDVYYDYALYEWKTGKEQLSGEYLRMSLTLGFSDRIKLQNDFPVNFLNEITNMKN